MGNQRAWLCCFFMVVISGIGIGHADDQDQQTDQTTRELDAYWAEVSRCVRQGDFEGYSATCHPQGILVSGVKKSSYPLAKALERWKQGIEDTREGRIKASVEFRFSQRIHDQTTAHETGIFRYATESDGKQDVTYVNFEGLLQKSPAGWQIMMEYQKSIATEAEWQSLAPKIE